MLEKIKDLPPGIEGLKATGKVSKADYDQVFEPLLEEARRDGRRLRFLYQLGPQFEGITASGVWEDAKLGLRALRLFDGCALVGDAKWMQESARLVGFFMPCPVKVFGTAERDEAIAWLGSLPEGPAISHQLLAEKGVLVVEIKQALRAQDFDALGLTADTWIEGHGNLNGVVLHARDFPGWENLGSLVRHFRFVREHQRKVRKIALATDSKIASLAPRIAEHFVRAELKHFGYVELDAAIEWAARPEEPSAKH